MSNKASGIILDAQKFAEESPYLSNYLKFYDDYKCAVPNSDFFGINLIKVLEKEPHRAKEFEQIAKQITEKMQQLNYPKSCVNAGVKNLLDLYYYNPEAYEHVIKSKKLIDVLFLNGYQLNKNISVDMLKEMEKGSSDLILASYVENSDNVYKSPKAIQQLREFLSQHKTEKALSVSRGVRHTGAFNNVELPESMTKTIKLINKMLMPFTKKQVFQNTPTAIFSQAQKKLTFMIT